MTLKQIMHFVVLAEELHFGRAAKRLHISQPPLSMSIQQLEQSLGFSLFDRTNKSVQLTAAGALFYKEALHLLRHANDMRRVGEQVAKGISGQLRLGFASSMLFRGLSQHIKHFQQHYPDVEVSLKELNSGEQLKALQREQIDVGFVHNHQDEDDLQTRLFLAEPFLCCLPSDHLLSRHPQLAIKQLRHENFLLFPRSLSPHYHDRIMAICATADFSPRISHESRNWLTIVELVAQGLGIALVPQSMQRLIKSDVCYRPIDNHHILSETHCVWKPLPQSVLRDNFLQQIFPN